MRRGTNIHSDSEPRSRLSFRNKICELPTLREVAKMAGVGTSTVSRVINGGALVSPETLDRVHTAIASLGYVPSHAARSLKGGLTKTIGLIIPSIADPFFSACAEAIQSVARANKSLLIVLATQNDLNTEIENLRILMSHRADGVIIVPSNPRSAALHNMLSRISMPVVAVDRPISHPSVMSVVVDNFKGSRDATQHLIDHGYRRIVCLAAEETFTAQERIRGYRAAVTAHRLPSTVIASIKDSSSAEYVIESLFAGANPPDALLTLKNSTTIRVYECLKKLDISVPDPVALIGFDDFELAAVVSPPISVIEQPIEEIGRIAARLLFNRLLGRNNGDLLANSKSASKITLHTHLIMRGSCGCRGVIEAVRRGPEFPLPVEVTRRRIAMDLSSR